MTTTVDMYASAVTGVASTARLGGDVRVIMSSGPSSVLASHTTADAARHRRALLEDLIAWSVDPNGIDREALENVDRDAWGINR